MADSTSCPFCQWLQGNADKPPLVFEDDHLIATLCESPIAPGHTQIAFKKHYHELSLVEPADGARLGNLIPVLSAAIKQGLGAEMIYVACISEEVRHVHFHLVPRYAGSQKGFGHFMGERQQLSETAKIIEAIQKAMNVPV